MGNFFCNEYDLYCEVKKDPEAFLWKIVSATSICGVDITEDVKDAISEVITSKNYDSVSDVCKRIFTIINDAIGVRPIVEKKKGK